jgi:hypothetical protein
MPTCRILLDNNVPLPLNALLRPPEAVHASRIGLPAVSNGELIRSAHAPASG